MKTQGKFTFLCPPKVRAVYRLTNNICVALFFTRTLRTVKTKRTTSFDGNGFNAKITTILLHHMMQPTMAWIKRIEKPTIILLERCRAFVHEIVFPEGRYKLSGTIAFCDAMLFFSLALAVE